MSEDKDKHEQGRPLPNGTLPNVPLDQWRLAAESQPPRRWLASLLLRRGGALPSRFALFYRRVLALPRQVRRQLVRKSAAALAGTALLLALSRAPTSDHIAHAATITVDGATCNLVDAILSAENDASYGGCDPGSGPDTIDLQTDVTLTTSYGVYYQSETGLPLVMTEITIEGNGHTIERDSGGDKFRLLAVSSSGDLTINDATLSGGYAYLRVQGGYYPYYYYTYYGSGGAVYNNGTLTITNSEISGNEAYDKGGGLSVDEGVVTIGDSVLSGNTAKRAGAIYNRYAEMTITNSTLNDNTATGGNGGAIYHDQGELTITNSTLSGNSAAYGGGGAIYNDFGRTTITTSTLSGNTASGGGGVFSRAGTMTITASTISGNSTTYSGGGVFNYDGELTITTSTISGNSTASYSGGGVFNDSGDVTITTSTISGNSTTDKGGGVYNDSGDVTLTNSTLSGNSATNNGGGVYNDFGDVTLTNSTITDNTAGSNGGGVYQCSGNGNIFFERSLVSGNSATNGSEVYLCVNGAAEANNRNLFGHSGLTSAQAFVNFAPGATDVNATSDGGTPYTLTAILEAMLADNGGPETGSPGSEEPMLTHALVSGSPAIDKAPNAACNAMPTSGEDQRGYVRNVDGDNTVSNNECDVGAFEYASFAPEAEIYMTAAGPGTTGNGVAFGKEDILRWDGSQWSKVFDGTDEGLTNKHDINAIHVNDANDLYLSFFQNKIMTAGVGQVFGHDILHFDGAGFELYFDGSDVGLTTTAEKVDALHILDGSLSPVGGSCEAYLLLSTLGTGKVPASGGGMLNFQGEDILGFCVTNSGTDTEGFWHILVDGSAEGMPKNSTDSLSASDDGDVIYLTTQGAFSVDSASGSHSEVYKFESGSFSGPFFSAPANGLNQKVDGLHVEGDLP